MEKRKPRQLSGGIEFDGATIEEAIKKALATLKVKKNEVEIEVLKEEHKGLFGMEGAHPARIKITPKKKRNTEGNRD